MSPVAGMTQGSNLNYTPMLALCRWLRAAKRRGFDGGRVRCAGRPRHAGRWSKRSCASLAAASIKLLAATGGTIDYCVPKVATCYPADTALAWSLITRGPQGEDTGAEMANCSRLGTINHNEWGLLCLETAYFRANELDLSVVSTHWGLVTHIYASLSWAIITYAFSQH